MGVMVSTRETTFAASRTGSISEYRQMVGGRPARSRFVNFFFIASRSYLTQSGFWQAVQRLWIWPASYFWPQLAHSRCVTKFILVGKVRLQSNGLAIIFLFSKYICCKLHQSLGRNRCVDASHAGGCGKAANL